MNKEERDQLLFRLDERSNNSWRLMEKVEAHLAELNRTVASHNRNIAVHKSNITRIWWLIGGIFIMLTSFLTASIWG